jgi:hypothetical protein
VKHFEGDMDTPRTAGGVIRIAENALQSVDDIGAALRGDMVTDPNVHARALTYWLPRSDDGLEIAYRCRMELNKFQKPFMGGNRCWPPQVRPAKSLAGRYLPTLRLVDVLTAFRWLIELPHQLGNPVGDLLA